MKKQDPTVKEVKKVICDLTDRIHRYHHTSKNNPHKWIRDRAADRLAILVGIRAQLRKAINERSIGN